MEVQKLKYELTLMHGLLNVKIENRRCTRLRKYENNAHIGWKYYLVSPEGDAEEIIIDRENAKFKVMGKVFTGIGLEKYLESNKQLHEHYIGVDTAKACQGKIIPAVHPYQKRQTFIDSDNRIEFEFLIDDEKASLGDNLLIIADNWIYAMARLPSTNHTVISNIVSNGGRVSCEHEKGMSLNSEVFSWRNECELLQSIVHSFDSRCQFVWVNGYKFLVDEVDQIYWLGEEEDVVPNIEKIINYKKARPVKAYRLRALPDFKDGATMSDYIELMESWLEENYKISCKDLSSDYKKICSMNLK